MIHGIRIVTITESDAQLVAATVGGDRGAFAKLVERYERIVKAVTYKVIGDHHASEDAAQDAFVIAFRSLPRLRNPALFGGWLARIARRHAQRLSQGRRRDFQLENAAEVAGQEGGRADHDSERLLAILMQLPERERQTLLLRHFGGHSVADIARMSGRPVGTITKQLSRGYARLRKQLQEIEL
jgi:RNA polymerase sigma-70 factor, ECF subfamily